MTERTEYYPYGSVAATASNQDIGNHYKFTGKEADVENNLQYFGARYYDNRVGKFTAIDPYGLQTSQLLKILSDPQQLNGYSYTRNNPIILVDPDGNRSEYAWDVWNWAPGFKQFADYADQHTTGAASATTSAIPIVGDIKDMSEAIAGRDSFTGEKLSASQRVVAGVLSIIPLAGAGTVREVGRGVKGTFQTLVKESRTISNLKGSFELGYHARLRAFQRNISDSTLSDILETKNPFNYFHEGQWKQGFADLEKGIFVGVDSVTHKVITLMDNINQNYVNNLLEKTKKYEDSLR